MTMRTPVLLAATAVLAACAAPAAGGRARPSPDAPAVLAEADRLGAADLWPGFDPLGIPVALFDGERTWLSRHPAPPTGYVPAAGHPGLFVRDGRDSLVWANSSVVMAGVRTATVMPFAPALGVSARAAVVLHEAFHVFQRSRHPSWTANEGELFTYPVADGALLGLRRLESEALRRALAAGDARVAGCWARQAMALRRERFGGMSAGAAGYERFSELNEGLASYVQARARGFDAPLLPAEEFAADAVRDRFYATGPAMGRLLDRLAPGWRAHLEAADSLHVDALLAAATADAPVDACGFESAERQRLAARATADADSLRSRLAAARREFLARGGWQLTVVAAGEPLWPQGFDPLNVRVVAPGDVLHGRMLQLGNRAGSLEVLGRATLTAAAGAHPLFGGVREATLTGLTAEPAVEDSAGVVRIAADGLRARFRGAQVTRAGRRIELRLP